MCQNPQVLPRRWTLNIVNCQCSESHPTSCWMEQLRAGVSKCKHFGSNSNWIWWEISSFFLYEINTNNLREFKSNVGVSRICGILLWEWLFCDSVVFCLFSMLFYTRFPVNRCQTLHNKCVWHNVTKVITYFFCRQHLECICNIQETADIKL